MKPPPIQNMPIKGTGVYRNPVTGKYEFWFVHPIKKRKAMVGECLFSASNSVRDMWITETWAKLIKLVEDKIRGDRTVRAVIQQMVRDSISGIYILD